MDLDRARALNAPIRTARLSFEPLLGTHAAALFPLLSDPRTHAWIDPPRASSVEELRAIWAGRESRVAADGTRASLGWAMRDAEGRLVGKIDAHVNDQGVATNVGYVVAADAWGRGYATEALTAVVEHLAGIGVGELHAFVRAGNVASMRVLARVGFTPTGTGSDGADATDTRPVDRWVLRRGRSR